MSQTTTTTSNIKNVLCILSGKGGVGKSTVSCQLAFTLSNNNKKVGILDLDITGPSVPTILGVSNENVFQSEENGNYLPVKVNDNLICMSIGFLLKNKDDAIIWRGPKKHSLIKQFINQVEWGDLDFLIIDTPPGTSDEHVTLGEINKEQFGENIMKSILVTTPQLVSMRDVSREINFCKKLNISIIGIIENMSGYKCPCCNEITFIFGKEGGKILCQDYQLNYLGNIPIEMELANAEEQGKDFTKHYPNSFSAKCIQEIVKVVLEKLNVGNTEQ
ncbi:hypothetical protein ABK040_014470 [Willaertia magna]